MPSSGEYIKGPDWHRKRYVPSDAWQQSCDRVGRTWENWVWQPYDVDRCSVFVEEVYGANLCSVSSRPCARENLYQTILFVGDSLTFQMYASLVLQYGSSKEAADEKQQMNSEKVSP